MGLVPGTWFQMSHPRAHFHDSPGSFMSQHHGILDNKIPNSTVLPVVNVRATDPNGMHAQEDLCQKRREGSLQKNQPSQALKEQHTGCSWVPEQTPSQYRHMQIYWHSINTPELCVHTLEEWHVHEPPAEIQNYAMIHIVRRLKIG